MKPNYLKINEINLSEIFPLVVFDTETTGLKPQECEIIEVSAIKYGHGFEVIDTYSTYCRPLFGIPEITKSIHHLDEKILAPYKPFAFYRDEFQQFIDGCNLLGYNTGFDIGFLEANGVIFDENVKYIDACRIAKKKYKRRPKCNEKPCDDWIVEGHKLTQMCDYFGIDCRNAHDSLADCKMTAEVLEAMLKD